MPRVQHFSPTTINASNDLVMTWTVNVDRCLVILPLFLSYVLGSFASLRIWLAVQKTPTVTKADEATIVRGRNDSKRRFMHFIACSTMIFAMGYLAFEESSSLLSRGFINFSLMLVMASCVVQSVLRAFGMRHSVHRNLDGTLYIKPSFFDHSQVRRRTKLGTAILLSVGLPAVTLWYHSNVGASIIVFTILYFIQTNNNPRKMSMRQMIIVAIVMEAVLLVYFASLFAVILSDAIKADVTLIKRLHEHFTQHSGDFTNWIYVPCMGLPLSFIISISLRFDYANHVASIQSLQDIPVDPIVLQEVPAPETTCLAKQLTPGIVVPSVIPVAFDCPYFLSTLLMWIFTNAAVMQLLAYGWLPDFGRFVYSLYVLLCALPMEVLSVVVVSMVRGEVKRMWSYEEHWNLEPLAVETGEKSQKLVDLKEEHV